MITEALSWLNNATNTLKINFTQCRYNLDVTSYNHIIEIHFKLFHYICLAKNPKIFIVYAGVACCKYLIIRYGQGGAFKFRV